MQRALPVSLALVLTTGLAVSQEPTEEVKPTLELGIQQVNDGKFQAGISTLEALIREQVLDADSPFRELAQAYLYRGVAFVGLAQEQNAKGSFAAALLYDKTLRIGEDKFSPRVVRVFEAARLGKAKSVLLPPSGAAKKAGIGALGIAGIVAGVLAAGGAAVVSSRKEPSPSPFAGPSPPSPTTTPPPPSANRPPTFVHHVTPDPATGSAPLNVTVNMCQSSDPDADTLKFDTQWGDGARSTPCSASPPT